MFRDHGGVYYALPDGSKIVELETGATIHSGTAAWAVTDRTRLTVEGDVQVAA